MSELRTIYIDWYNGSVRTTGGSQLAYQYDHLSNLVIFGNAPRLDNYYLIVEMKETEDGPVRTLEPIQLGGSFWLIPNSYTQLAQNISFQVCCKTPSGDFERHSAQFTGVILPSKNHDGAVLDVDPSIMFDPYKQWVSDIAMAAGAIVIDPTLSVRGAAADAKAVGDYIMTDAEAVNLLVEVSDDEERDFIGEVMSSKLYNQLKPTIDKLAENDAELNERLEELEGGGTGGLTADVKAALLACFNHVAWDSADPTGQSYISALQTALYPPANLSSISAVFTQSGTVLDTASLDDLKSDLVVTAHYSDSTTEVVASTAYALSGILAEGTSTVTVTYGGKTTTFTVTVTAYAPPDTSAVIKSVGKGYSTSGEELSQNGTSTTEPMSVGQTFTAADGNQSIMIFAPRAEGASFSASKNKIPRYLDGVFVNYNNMSYVTYGDESATEQQFSPSASEYNQMAFTLATGYEEDSYAYVVSTGYIIFAGKNTKYYGMSNISEAV